MNHIRYIRKTVLQLTQAKFGAIAGAPQSVVSRWETGILEPNLSNLSNIREYARGQRIGWNDRWFFEGGPRDAREVRA